MDREIIAPTPSTPVIFAESKKRGMMYVPNQEASSLAKTGLKAYLPN